MTSVKKCAVDPPALGLGRGKWEAAHTDRHHATDDVGRQGYPVIQIFSAYIYPRLLPGSWLSLSRFNSLTQDVDTSVVVTRAWGLTRCPNHGNREAQTGTSGTVGCTATGVCWDWHRIDLGLGTSLAHLSASRA